MNRLCLGALGLLVLAVSCFAGPGHHGDGGKDAIILGDYKEAGKNYGRDFKLTAEQKTHLSYLLKEPAKAKFQFVIEATKFLYFSKTSASEEEVLRAKNKKDIMKKLSGLSKKSLAGESPEEQLADLESSKDLKDFKKLDNRGLLRRYTAELFLSLAMYIEREGDNIDAQMKETSALGKVMKDLYVEKKDFGEREKGEIHYMSELHNIEKETHSPDWNKAKWDKEYGSLPSIAKYFANGLHPTKKRRLHKQLEVAEEEGIYLKKKEESQKHIDHIAVKARLEAISHSHTAAGEYFANHENWIKTKLDELYEDHRGGNMNVNKDISLEQYKEKNMKKMGGGHSH